jgi:ribonuclease P protein component
MLNKKNRIADSHTITALFRKGALFKASRFSFRFFDKPESPAQFSITISKKVIKKAVDRNRLKRQIAEAIRLNLDQLKGNFLIAVIARSSAASCDYAVITQDVLTFFNHLNSNAT